MECLTRPPARLTVLVNCALLVYLPLSASQLHANVYMHS